MSITRERRDELRRRCAQMRGYFHVVSADDASALLDALDATELERDAAKSCGPDGACGECYACLKEQLLAAHDADEASTRRAEAAERELCRLRHGATIEGDGLLCPDTLRLREVEKERDGARAEVEALRKVADAARLVCDCIGYDAKTAAAIDALRMALMRGER